MKVILSSIGNPDQGQDPTQPLFGCEPCKTLPVSSFKEARDLCIKFISDNNLGSGNWNGGQILDDNEKVIAFVSCNGRVWEGSENSIDAKEILI